MNRLHKLRHSLIVRALALAMLNAIVVLALGLVMMGTAYGRGLIDFVRTPVGDRILAVSRKIALDLLENDSESWDLILERAAQGTPFQFALLDSEGRQIAGPPMQMPQRLRQFSANRDSNLTYTPKWDSSDRPDTSYLKGNFFLERDKESKMYWAGVHVLIHYMDDNMYGHGTLVWRFSRVWTNTYFFNVWPYAFLLLGAFFLTTAFWFPAVALLLRRVSRLTAATREIAKGNFDAELPTARDDEIGQLSESVAIMSRQISGLIQQQQRFVSDAAHELCSPMSRMQIAVELLEREHAAKGSATDGEPIENDEPYFSDLAEEVHQMSELIQDLLFYSRTRNAPLSIPSEGVALAPLVRNVIDREGLQGKGIVTNIASDILVQVSPVHLRRAVANLLRNAQQYGGESGHVEVAAAVKGRSAHLFVRDHGPGIPEEELEQVFAPFYRVEYARSRLTGGTGLGLAIVKSCIEACGGTVCCRNLHPSGLEVEMTLPLSTVVAQTMLELQSAA
jgi:two-component system sensor histidine kinase CpxA